MKQHALFALVLALGLGFVAAPAAAQDPVAPVAPVAPAAPAAPENPAAPPAPRSHFVFKVPDGWTDKSPPDTRDFLIVAYDEPNQLVFQAKVAGGGPPVTPKFLDEYTAEAQRSVAKIVKGAKLKVLKKDLYDVDHTISARFVFEMPAPPGSDNKQEVRTLQYYVPAGDQHAVLTFTAPRKTYEKFEKLFDTTARSTTVKRN